MMQQATSTRRALGLLVQRNRTDDDCAIAATANLLGIPYGRAAEAFGRVVGEDGMPSSVDGKEPSISDVSAVVDQLGHPNQLVFGPATLRGLSTPIPPSVPVVNSNSELRPLLRGREGIVMELDKDDEGHCLVWRDERLIDPRAENPYSRRLYGLSVLGAVILQ